MVINSFTGKNRFLSNFYPCSVRYEDDVYPSVEHAYQASKTDDPVFRRLIRSIETPSEAKRVGKDLTFNVPFKMSHVIKVGAMLALLHHKFKNPELRQLLLDTGDCELIEGNYWGDTFWGVCDGKGENWLGKSLMFVRDSIRREQK
jgi:N-glycosidase YbiA